MLAYRRVTHIILGVAVGNLKLGSHSTVSFEDEQRHRALSFLVASAPKASFLQKIDEIVENCGVLVSEYHVKLLARLGREKLWQEALQLFDAFLLRRLQPSQLGYKALAYGIHGSWRHSLALITLQQSQAFETLPSLPLICKSFRSMSHLHWPFSLQLISHAKERVQHVQLQRLRQHDPQRLKLLDDFWATCSACFQTLEDAGCWLEALQLLQNLMEPKLWRSARLIYRQDLSTSAIGACERAGEWQWALQLLHDLQAFTNSMALQLVMRSCAEAEAWQVNLSLLGSM
eukprot:symbB.v1.2.002344.t1/scaffold121.1/size317807/8